MATLQAAAEHGIGSYRSPLTFRRSPASLIVWLAIASDVESLWRDGKLIQADGLWADDPFCTIYGQAFAGSAPPSWVEQALGALDRELSAISNIEKSLSKRDFVAPLSPAIARIPVIADEQSVAYCIFASRLLISRRHLLIPPAFVTAEAALSNLRDASFLAAIVGGPDAILEAIRIANRPGMYEVSDETDDVVEFGEIK